MAVNSIVFGGVDSADYGIYISGEGVFNAPKRDVEMIEIPGRNGAFALDKGRFENIEVAYPAFNFEPGDYNTFVKNLSDFRNAICSLKGYQRLTDSFHPNEYRMAVYRDGLEVKPIKYNTASEFEITFDCKPQRWLTSGETKQTIANSGDTITNPTLFDASPLLEVEGYGEISLNGHEIELTNETLGEVELFTQKTYASSAAATYNIPPIVFNSALINNGDTFTMDSLRTSFYYGSFLPHGSMQLDSAYKFKNDYPTTTKTNMVFGSFVFINSSNSGFPYGSLSGLLSPITFTKGIASTVTGSVAIDKAIVNSSQVEVETIHFEVSVSVSYDGDDTISATVTKAVSNDTLGICTFIASSSAPQKISNGIAMSTVTMLGTPTYIDCDIGEAYKYEGGEIVSLNSYIDLGSILPTLAPGSNAITFDNTITDLKVTPRWWKV